MSTINFNFSSNLSVRRIQYMDLLVKHGGFSYETLSAMSLAELRDEVDYLFPQTLTVRSITRSGGTSVRTVIKAKKK